MRTTAIVIVTLALASCQSPDSDTTGRTVAGAGGGAAAGAVIGALTGDWGKGAAIGALIGSVGGLGYDQWEKRKAEQEAAEDAKTRASQPVPLARPKPSITVEEM